MRYVSPTSVSVKPVYLPSTSIGCAGEATGPTNKQITVTGSWHDLFHANKPRYLCDLLSYMILVGVIITLFHLQSISLSRGVHEYYIITITCWFTKEMAYRGEDLFDLTVESSPWPGRCRRDGSHVWALWLVRSTALCREHESLKL